MRCHSYLEFVRSWQKYFPAENIKIVYFDTLEEDHQSFLKEIMRFLELNIELYDFDDTELKTPINMSSEVSIPFEYEEYLTYLYEPYMREWADYSQNKYAMSWVSKLDGKKLK